MNQRSIICCILLMLPLLAHCGGREEKSLPPSEIAATIMATPRVGVNLETVLPPTAVQSELTPTPLSRATISPTPAPVVYVVEAGDNLLGIAREHNTTVAELEALNPTLQPELLQVGQQLILPTEANLITDVSAGTLLPSVIEVVGTNQYQTPSGSLWILGEVNNGGEQAVENVRIEITLHDKLGETQLTTRAWALPGIIRAGERAPFGALIVQPPADYDGGVPAITTAVTSGDPVANLGNRYLDLAVTGTEIASEDRLVELSGRLQNIGQKAAVEISLITVFYGEQGQVTGYHEVVIDGPLAPGQEVPFRIETIPPGGRSVDFRFAAQALQAADG